MQYLHEEQYYIDLYDFHTLEECLDWYFRLKKGMDEKREELKDMTSEAFDNYVHKLYTTSGLELKQHTLSK